MPLRISPVTDPTDYLHISPMDHDAWQTPYNPQLKHFRPAFATRAEAIAYVTAREQARLASPDPGRFALKVCDEETGEIIGYAVWAINDPAAEEEGGGKTVATWYPEGSEEREFAGIFINGLWGFLGRRVRGKHMDLHSLIVHPSQRHRGAGRLLIRWGIEKADELGIETVVSSLNSARGAYEKCGLGFIEMIPPDPELFVEKEGRGEKWKELLDDDLTGCLMWRPIGRDFREGDKAPWKEESR